MKKIICVTMLLILANATYANQLYVDAQAAGQTGQDGSLEHPYSAIQTAIDAALTGDIVTVREGKYAAVNFGGKSLTLTSTEPQKWMVVERTIIQSSAGVTFSGTEISDCILTGFTITGATSGGIIGNLTQATISHCIIRNNTNFNAFPQAGGGISKVRGLISHCIIRDNNSSDMAGGIYAETSAAIRNCLILRNSARYGGGLYLKDCAALVENCTIVDNSSLTAGGAFRLSNIGEKIFRNTVFWGNTSPQGPTGSLSSAAVTLVSCDLPSGTQEIYGGTTTWLGNNLRVDPSFVENGNYHLNASSPCIDAGATGNIWTNDLDNLSRTKDGNHVGNALIDLGCYEFQRAGNLLVMPQVCNIFAAYPASEPITYQLQITKFETDTVSWQANEDCPWLSVSPPSGNCANTSKVTFLVNTTDLAFGNYTTTVNFQDLAFPAEEQNIIVNLVYYPALRVPQDYNTIQTAINTAITGDVIIVAPGTYGPINYNGKAIVVKSTNPQNWNTIKTTIIDANYSGSCVIFNHNEMIASTLLGFTLTKGKGTDFVSGYTTYKYGGGIFCANASPVICNCYILRNGYDSSNQQVYTNYGGGIAVLLILR